MKIFSADQIKKWDAYTIAHEPIASLRWPAMTMNFRVQSAEVLRGVTVGGRVHFVLQNQNGQPVVIAIHAS